MRKTIITFCLALLALAGMAQSPFSFHAKAGIGTSNFWGKHSNSETKIAYKTGVGAEYALNGTWVLQSALEFVAIGGKDEIGHVGNADINELYLQLPVMMAGQGLSCFAECRSLHSLRCRWKNNRRVVQGI